jgi:hypothetical protein
MTTNIFRRCLAIAMTVALPTLGMIDAAGASASDGSLTWEFTSIHVDASSPVGVTYASTGVRPGSLLVFQRQFGSAKVWKSVAKFTIGGSRTVTTSLPSDPIGSYLYRGVIEVHGKTVMQTPDRFLYSYGAVPLSTICSEMSSGDGGCSVGSVQLQNSIIYNYEFSDYTESQASPGDDELSFPATSCDSGSLTITVGLIDNTNPGGSATVQIAQSASDPQIVTIPDTSQQLFNFNLDGGPFIIDDWYTPGSNNNSYERLFYSGTFDCYTLNGLK